MRITFAIAVFLASTSLAAQTSTDGVPLNDLKTPPSPAFVLMGIAPSAVERPTTPRALGTSLLSGLNDGNTSSLPKNFALDVAPYWLQNHPELTYDAYTKAGLVQSIKQTLSVSLATKEQDPVDASIKTKDTLGGAGIRAAWLAGAPSTAETKLRDRLVNLLSGLASAGGPPVSGNVVAPPIISAGSPAAEAVTKLIDAIRDARYEGRWYFEGAAASTALFTGNSSSHSQHQKSGVWITTSYRLSHTTIDDTKTGADGVTLQPNIDFVGVVRTINDHTATTDAHPLDIGARLLWQTGDLSISAEHIQRTRIAKKTRRTAAVGEFKVNDNLYLTATVGRNFKDESGNGDLLGIFGIHFSVGKKPVLKDH